MGLLALLIIIPVVLAGLLILSGLMLLMLKLVSGRRCGWRVGAFMSILATAGLLFFIAMLLASPTESTSVHNGNWRSVPPNPDSEPWSNHRAAGSEQLVAVPPEEFAEVTTAESAIPDGAIAERASEAPGWIGQKPSLSGDVYQTPVQTLLWADVEESRAALLPVARKQVEAYLADLGEPLVATAVPDAYIQEHVIRERYFEPVQSDLLDQTMYRGHALLVFDRGVKQQLQEYGRAARVADRLWLAGGAAGAVLAVLFGLWMCLTLAPEKKPVPAPPQPVAT